ncbi:TetR/AcrR family transcriptional regulator [Actinomadura xylanilytica]|uniref:TetR/AcrR family transcriptional regulator n=1 Tax=Actinomadura xylanilytica TaxID=887459 RepID=UPI00255B03C9|nr:TetR/AcrR family transcriptional regulator [Actinomadura xylanilytica]MDL4776335.1 helix-turn-helix domain-containing protein [Actinomadura xylanilytica]
MSPRMSAADRRELTIRAAIAEFARGGYEGTSTSAIAERVGVSQPYLFRLFPSKRALFLAAAERCFDDIEGEMRDAAGGLYGGEAMTAMGARYRKLLHGDTTLLQFQLQIYAAALSDGDVRRVGHDRWARLLRTVGELSGEGRQEVMRFASVGMLLNVLTAFDVPHAWGDDLPESLGRWAEGAGTAEGDGGEGLEGSTG